MVAVRSSIEQCCLIVLQQAVASVVKLAPLADFLIARAPEHDYVRQAKYHCC